MSHIWIVNHGDTEAVIAQQLADGVYEGRNLAELHQAEISRYANPHEWIRGRIDSQYYLGVHPGDYIPYTCTNGTQIRSMIMGINTYNGYKCTYACPVSKPHIDFIGKDLWPTVRAVNQVDYNNGTAAQPSPWMASDLRHYINSMSGQVPGGTAVGGTPLVDVDYTQDGIWYYLPADLQAAIDGSQRKRIMAPIRYAASGVLASDNNLTSLELDRLWLPYDSEVRGQPGLAGSDYQTAGTVQYAAFAHSVHNWLLYRSGTQFSWWTASARQGFTVRFMCVSPWAYQVAANHPAGEGVPICYRLTA